MIRVRVLWVGSEDGLRQIRKTILVGIHFRVVGRFERGRGN